MTTTMTDLQWMEQGLADMRQGYALVCEDPDAEAWYLAGCREEMALLDAAIARARGRLHA